MTGTKPVLDSPRRTPAARKQRRASAFRKFVFGVFALIIIATAAACGSLHTNPLGLWRMLGMGAGYVADKTFRVPPFHGKRHVNILILGVDTNFVDKGPHRSDTIKLASIDLDKQSIAMLSVPRDTWIDIPEHGHSKINSAFQYGDSEDEHIASAKSIIGNYLGELYGQPIPIDYYVRIQTGGFKQVVDALGGVTIDVEKQMDYEDTYQNLYIHLKPGRQVLNGTDAMGYVRFRHDAEGDYGRMRRQDQFIRALAAEMQKPGMEKNVVALLGKIYGENQEKNQFLVTDLRLNDIRAVKRLASTLGMEGIYTVQLPTEPGWKGRASVVEVTDLTAAQQTIAEVLSGPRPTVTVLNGSGRRNLGRAVSAEIDASHFNVVGVGTLPEPVESSEILAVKRCKNEAQTLAAQLGVQEIDTESTVPEANFGRHAPPPPPSQITLVLGKDYGVQQQARGTE